MDAILITSIVIVFLAFILLVTGVILVKQDSTRSAGLIILYIAASLVFVGIVVMLAGVVKERVCFPTEKIEPALRNDAIVKYKGRNLYVTTQDLIQRERRDNEESFKRRYVPRKSM